MMRVVREATKTLIAGNADQAFQMAAEFIDSDDWSTQVLTYMQATPDDLRSVFQEMCAFTWLDGLARGNSIAVWALLDPETLAYLLRAERGDVDKNNAYKLVAAYFRTNSTGFEPEREFRARHGP